VTKSPTALSLELLRREGWKAENVEQWIPRGKTRRDLFGVIDIIAIRGVETMGVQTTTTTNVSHRVEKINASEYLEAMRAAGWRIVVHGWYPDGRVREIEI
jgi:hypothetical protein